MSASRRGPIARLLRLILMAPPLLMLLAAGAWFAARPATPDAFYNAAVPEAAGPGTLLRSEAFTRDVPTGAKGWRFLYVTTRGQERVVASGVLVVPERSGTDLPVIAWAHGTTGIVAGCAPSVLARPFDNVPDMSAIVREGWAYVGTDYPGLGTDGGHAYLVGADAARAVVDAVRAARQLRGVALSDRVVVWGHSQGGNSALWAGMRAPMLAPELKVLGVAALAPASDLKGLVQANKGSMFGKIVSSYLVEAYARAYPDVIMSAYVGTATRLITRDIAARCVAGYGTLVSVAQTILLPADGIFSSDPTAGALGARLAENTPSGLIPAPVLIAQGDMDDLVLPEVQKRFVAARCAAGQAIDYRTYPGRDHVSVVAAASPLAQDLVQWTRERFEGQPAKSACR